MKPTSFEIPKNSCSRGLRRSQPTITTSWPAAAMVYARLQLMVVLPSVAFPLVTRRVRIGSSIDMNWIEVRMLRKASAAGPLGCSAVMSNGTRRSVHSLMAGINPKAGIPGVTRSRSDRERILSSMASWSRARAMPTASPTRPARRMSEVGLGLMGDDGG